VQEFIQNNVVLLIAVGFRRNLKHDDSDNIRFIFHFLVPETHKASCEIRDCKKKTQTSRGEKK